MIEIEHKLTKMNHKQTKKLDSRGVINAEYKPINNNPITKSESYWTVALVIILVCLVGLVLSI